MNPVNSVVDIFNSILDNLMMMYGRSVGVGVLQLSYTRTTLGVTNHKEGLGPIYVTLMCMLFSIVFIFTLIAGARKIIYYHIFLILRLRLLR